MFAYSLKIRIMKLLVTIFLSMTSLIGASQNTYVYKKNYSTGQIEVFKSLGGLPVGMPIMKTKINTWGYLRLRGCSLPSLVFAFVVLRILWLFQMIFDLFKKKYFKFILLFEEDKSSASPLLVHRQIHRTIFAVTCFLTSNELLNYKSKAVTF